MVLTGRNRHVIFSGVLLLQTETKNYIEVRLGKNFRLINDDVFYIDLGYSVK
jgi:hypothetical protein